MSYNFTFSPRPKSKLLDGTTSDSETEIEDYQQDESDQWLSVNERKRNKKQKRKIQESSPENFNFKKQYKKSTKKKRKSKFHHNFNCPTN